MSISPTSYSPGYLVSKLAQEKENPRVKDCIVCGRGMYKMPCCDYIECENCEHREGEG